VKEEEKDGFNRRLTFEKPSLVQNIELGFKGNINEAK